MKTKLEQYLEDQEFELLTGAPPKALFGCDIFDKEGRLIKHVKSADIPLLGSSHELEYLKYQILRYNISAEFEANNLWPDDLI